MKSALAKKLSYIGGGIGVALFAIFGLLYGSFFGGVIGLNIVNVVSGAPATSDIISRVVVAMGIFSGALMAGVILVVSCTALGWVIGYIIDNALLARKKARQKQAFNH